jgi:hypothetical protein
MYISVLNPIKSPSLAYLCVFLKANTTNKSGNVSKTFSQATGYIPVAVNMNNKCAVEWMENGTVLRFQTSTVYCQFLWNLCMG